MPSNTSKKKLNITIGCDPEVWLRNNQTGKIESAHTLLPGTKNEPFKVFAGAIQVDGTAAEFNITPAKDWEHWLHNNDVVLAAIRSRVPNHTLVFEPTVVYDKEYFDSLPDEVKELGCNPDWNAWTNSINPSPDGSSYMRTAAGHMHFGWTKNADCEDPDHINDGNIVVRNCDYYLGMQSMRWDPDGTRRKLYGKAGAHRRKPYGTEYRTMSNKWLSTIDLQKYVFENAQLCMSRIINDNFDFTSVFGNAAQVIIDNNIQWWVDGELEKHKELFPHNISLHSLQKINSNYEIPVPKLPTPKKEETPKANYRYDIVNGRKVRVKVMDTVNIIDDF